jgi:hypothetical protein
MLELLLDEYPPEKGTREMLYAFIFWRTGKGDNARG